MRCTDKNMAVQGGPYGFWSSWRGWALVAALGGSAGWLSGCATREAVPAPVPSPAAAPRVTGPVPAVVVPQAPARTWEEYKLRAAQKLVAANQHMTYLGEVPEPLLAIPVIEIELRADGSIARIDVLRHPSQAKDTTQLAIDAIKRAAPFGDVSRLPKPWKFAEVFLFDDERRFKPRTLDN